MSCLDNNAPIGIFDSGVGGLSVAQEIARYLPNERIIYFADTAHVPYGARQDADIRMLTAQAVQWLYMQGCKAVVVACNTASAFSLEHLRQHYDFPIIGLVPALKPAVLQSKTKKVAVLATPATFRGQLIQNVMSQIAQPAAVQVLPITCLELVPLIESGKQNSPQMHQLLQALLQPVIEEGVDQLVLGCTHYPYLKSSIQHIFKEKLNLVDSGLAVAKHTAQVLSKYHLQTCQKYKTPIQLECYFSAGKLDDINGLLRQLLPSDISWSAKLAIL